MNISRRIYLVATLALLVGSAARAQTAKRPMRIGIAAAYPDASSLRMSAFFSALQDGLLAQGLVEGADYTWELRFFGGRPELREAQYQELADAKVDMLIAGVCGAPLDAARRASTSIPIVVPSCNDDLVDLGIIKSLNHPGGNITGLTKLTPELAPKRLQMLLQVVPKARRVVVLWNPAYSAFKSDWRELRVGADKLGVTLLPVEFRRPDDLEGALATAAGLRPDALMMFSDSLGYIFAPRVAKLASEHRLPGMFAFREVPDSGGLMSYGPSIPGMWRESARLIARVLRGEKAGDLPMEQPTRFELVVNLRAARALGLTVPQELLLRADAVIE